MSDNDEIPAAMIELATAGLRRPFEEAESLEALAIGVLRNAGVPALLADLAAARSRIETLENACRALLNAPHSDHFAVRLSDGEMHGLLNLIKAALAQRVKRDPGLPAPVAAGAGEGATDAPDDLPSRWRRVTDEIVARTPKGS